LAPIPSEIKTESDSAANVETKLTVTVTDAVSPGLTVADEALSVKVEVSTLWYALAEPFDITPNPNAATNASAMRLNDVDLLVICFLS